MVILIWMQAQLATSFRTRDDAVGSAWWTALFNDLLIAELFLKEEKHPGDRPAAAAAQRSGSRTGAAHGWGDHLHAGALAAFVSLQQFMVHGMTSGAVKG